MRITALAILVGWVWVAGGCTPVKVSVGNSVTVESSGYSVTMGIGGGAFVMGDTIQCDVTVRNTGWRSLHVNPQPGAPVYLTVWKNTGLGWTLTKSYPRSFDILVTPWVLKWRQEKTFTVTVPVEPDWPVNEPLKLTAEVNGLPDRPSIMVRVLPQPMSPR